VAELPETRAVRLSRARWLDTRLLLGLLLVLVSVVLGARLLAGADSRVEVWSVTRDLGADTPLSRDDVTATWVHLSGATHRYLSASQDPDGLVLIRPVGRGELLPAAAVGRTAATSQRRVVIEVDRVGVAGLAKGRVVDVYAVRDTPSDQTPPPPQLVLSGVTVAEDVRSGGGAFGGSGSTAGVALLVDQGDVPDLIDAVAHGSVYVVAVPSGSSS
jgi:hypothetical protein